jgi:hypothetical protein
MAANLRRKTGTYFNKFLELLDRFSRREETNKTLADHRDQLIAQEEGFTEDQLRAELAEFHVDEA